jgi:hypothetical protein
MDKPEYIPLPRTGTKCPYCGLCRSGINNLVLPTKANGYKAVVDSIVVRRPGKSRGRRLVIRASLDKYLNAQVVPLVKLSPEKLSLHRSWREFCAKPRCASPITSVDTASDEFLDDNQAEAAGI